MDTMQQLFGSAENVVLGALAVITGVILAAQVFLRSMSRVR